MSHFPPPWEWEYHPDIREPIALVSPEGDVLVGTGNDSASWLIAGPEHLALLAAAPEMLAALRSLLTAIDADPVGVPSYRAIVEAEAAVAKATTHPAGA